MCSLSQRQEPQQEAPGKRQHQGHMLGGEDGAPAASFIKQLTDGGQRKSGQGRAGQGPGGKGELELLVW